MTIPQLDSLSLSGKSQQNNHFSASFLIQALAIFDVKPLFVHELVIK
jgi:hypothetical protein